MNAWQMSPKVQSWMVKHIPKTATVLELGGGTGSQALHTHWRTTTVEHDERWTKYLRRNGHAVHHAPIQNGWYELSETLRTQLQQADVVVVDGPPGALRQNAAPHLDHIKPGAFVIFDDSHRKAVRQMISYPTIAVISDGNRTTHITKKPCPTSQGLKPDPHG